ncbi:MAG: pyruvate carboxylase [Candidatus Thiocaldithrix dubininis]|uniref:Pyruvate carboxylase n=1 Tax=Candidatus Thiocaldithrix dubininis TaxID=3080823 RepID=A0AA95H425_9GAMM|nr:MAG: pyruvate carboxylase [Candidatus Thiocaldithrix dubininis]
MTRPIKKLLVANRGEIAIRILRAAAELKLKTVSIYTHEDRFSPHRYKADEAYQIGKDDEPLKPYLDIEEIIAVAKRTQTDAIHPGYGFLSENVQLARRCREEGIIFVGPSPEAMERLGDKVAAKENAIAAGLPIIQDSKEPLVSVEIARKEADRIGYPLMMKAAAGGGGRGMRVIRHPDELERAFNDARSEAKKAFGDDTVFLEKYIDSPKHIEIQILGDTHGNLVHLYERDCSVQRRFQKVVEVAPSTGLKDETRENLYKYALAITHHVNYSCAGTVEFLVDKDENIYFIEVNPRVQVEHTITEEITGVDIVRSQILIAGGAKLSDPDIAIPSQEAISCNGYAVQCRITTEDPENGFKPDYGTIIAYRSTGGFGIRLDAGAAYPGAKISPFFDSMLVKVTAWGRTLEGAIRRNLRGLQEFRIRGVKTNIGFLENVLEHPVFMNGNCTVTFIDNHPELFHTPLRFDRGTKTLKYIANVTVNGNPDIKHVDPNKHFRKPIIPAFDKVGNYPKGTKNLLNEMGAEKFCQWVKDQPNIFYTDTTMRDAHQSLLATRVRTEDMLKVAEGLAKNHPQLFSLEMWGGATFDVSMRFLHECPWERLQLLREAIPNILFQMLFRGSNAVGYTAYPDNVVESFIEKSWENGIDVFRIFDSLNWIEGMRKSIQVVRERTGGIAEGTICYTGDVMRTDPGYKYNLQYYLDLAKQLEDAGAHSLAVKDMAGLLKPYAATKLITALKESVSIPIHLHTHDTSSVQSATLLKAIEAGVDIVDGCLSSMSGLTSQVNINSLIAAMEGQPREQAFNLKSLNEYANYWEDVREMYYPFESGLKAGTAEVYNHEIPGGQYSNLRPQAIALGLEDKFEEVKENYAVVNRMFGDIVKVTPSSKVVGDMAIYMTSNGLTEADVMQRGQNLAFPDSVIDLFKGGLGQQPGGFPEPLSNIILKGEKPYTGRPNDHLKPVNLDEEFAAFKQEFDPEQTYLDFLSFKMYPAVFRNFYKHQQEYGSLSHLPTPVFFYGLKLNEEVTVELGKGKVLIIRLLYRSPADENGMCLVTFEFNGQIRSVQIRDQSVKPTRATNRKAVGEKEIGTSLQGKLSAIMVVAGQEVEKNAPLFVIEAMKMETTITAPAAGKVKAVHLHAGELVEQGDLVVEME